MNEYIQGETISLRPATLADRKAVFEWLTSSDLTHMMLGAPHYTENRVPTWYEFVSDYHHSFFEGTKPLHGRCFIIEAGGSPVGQVNYNEIHAGPATELDIWLASSHYTGRGYGSDALKALCGHLATTYGCRQFYIAPSRRNVQAVNAYKKAGFTKTKDIPSWFEADYKDTVVMCMKTGE